MNAGAHRTLVRRDCDNLKATLLFYVMFHHDNNVIRLKTAPSLSWNFLLQLPKAGTDGFLPRVDVVEYV
jgi:hypothetical protein